MPTGNAEPDGGEQANETDGSQISLTKGAANGTAANPESCGNSSALIFVVQVISVGVGLPPPTTVKDTTAEHWPRSFDTTISGTQMIVGFPASAWKAPILKHNIAAIIKA